MSLAQELWWWYCLAGGSWQNKQIKKSLWWRKGVSLLTLCNTVLSGRTELNRPGLRVTVPVHLRWCVWRKRLVTGQWLTSTVPATCCDGVYKAAWMEKRRVETMWTSRGNLAALVEDGGGRGRRRGGAGKSPGQRGVTQCNTVDTIT